MNSIELLFSCHDELSNLTEQLQHHRKLLVNDPYIQYIQSPSTQSNKHHNSYYFPYYALVERYVGFADEYHRKLNEFKQLLLDSINTNTDKSNMQSDDNDISASSAMDIYHDTTPTPSTPTGSIVIDDTYLPIIDEDKETVYSYNSYNISTTTYSTLEDVESVDDDEDEDEEKENEYILQYDDSQYIYSSDSDDDDYNNDEYHVDTQYQPFIFTKPIYCSTLIYVSKTFGNDYKKLMDIFVDIGGIQREYIEDITFKRNYKGYNYGLVRIRESLECINSVIKSIKNYDRKIKINLFKTSYDRDYYFNMRPNQKLYVTNFDILNVNFYHNFMKIFAEFGELQSLQIFTINNTNNNVNGDGNCYALVQFKNIKDAIQCFNAHNIDINIYGYCNSLYFGHRLLHIEYANIQ